MSKFASLTAGLLARKGEAEPTSTPFAEQMLTRIGAPASDIRPMSPMPYSHGEIGVTKVPGLRVAAQTTDPLVAIFGSYGRRGPGEAFKPTLVPPPAPPPVIEHDHAQDCPSCAEAPPESPMKTFHVNLRLRRHRFVKLKLASALLRRPVNDIVSEALDGWFEKLPPDVLGDCACMKTKD